jgi:hypothetical protein
VAGCSQNLADSLTHRSLASALAPGGASAFKPDSIPGPPPPKPSPPPIVSVAFVGADSATAGQTANTYWQLGNPNHSTFTTHWTLTDEAGWPGFPIQGDVTLAPLSTQTLTVPISVPDSAAVGFYPLHMSVTQKRGGDATADGGIRVFGSGPDSLRSGSTR